MVEVTCVPEVITRMHTPHGKHHALEMFFVKCSCGELSQWFPEIQYAKGWCDKHLLVMATGVRHPTKSLSSPRVGTVYQQYRLLSEDERYDPRDRMLFKQMADELEGRVKLDGPDPDQMELF